MTAAEPLGELEEQHRALLAAMDEGVVRCGLIVDDAGRAVDLTIVEVNPAFARLTGLADVVGRRTSELVPELREDNGHMFEAIGRLRQGGGALRFDLHLPRLGGTFGVSMLSVRPDEIVCVFDNVTARRAAAEQFETFFDNAPIGKCMTGPDGKLLRVNPALCELLGYSAEELTRRSFAELTHPDDLPESRECVRCLLAGERDVWSMDKRYLARDGRVLWTHVTTRLLRDHSGKPRHFVTHILDISHRKDVEAALREREASLRLAQHIADVGSWECDPVTGEMRWSEQTYRQLGVPLDEVASLTRFLERVHEGDRAGLASRIGAAASFETEVRVVQPTGAVRQLIVRAEPLQDVPNAHLVGVGHDVTDRKRIEEDLRRIEWLLGRRREMREKAQYAAPYGDLVQLNTKRRIADALGPALLGDVVNDYLDLLDTSAAVYESNGDYALGIFSSGWCRFMDSASRKLCNTDDDREALASGRWHCHESCWGQASKPSMETDGPIDIRCLGGIRLHAVPIHAGDEIIGSINFGYGDPPRDEATLRTLAERYQVTVDELRAHAEAYESRPAHILELAKSRLHASARLIGEIVTRRRAETTIGEINVTLEERVRERTAQLESANHELEAFSYSVSHDLRAPLRAIDGFARMLREGHAAALDAEGLRLLETVCGEAQRMGALIDDLLSFSRMSRQAMHAGTINMRDLTATVFREAAALTPGRDLRLTLGDLPDAQGDLAMIRQALTNLVSNAIKYTRSREHAEIEIGGVAEGGELHYWVRDNGVGFDMKYAHKLFGVFQRLHSAAAFEGTGVGLALVQRIVTRHGGRVWADGKVNEGATFHLALPARGGANA